MKGPVDRGDGGVQSGVMDHLLHVRGRLLLRLGLVLLFLLLALVAGLWMYIPILIRAKAEQAIRAELGEQAGLRDVDVSMAASTISFNGFRLASEEIAGDPLAAFSFGSLQIQFESLWEAVRGNPVVTGVSLIGPAAVVQDLGPRPAVNLADVMERDGRLMDEITAAPPLRTARLEDARLELRHADPLLPPVLLFEEVSAELTGLPEVVADGEGDVALSAGGRLNGAVMSGAIRGRFRDPRGVDFDVLFTLDGFDLSTLPRGQGPAAALEIAGGIADFRLEGTVERGRLTGTVRYRLRDVRVQVNRRGPGERFLDTDATLAEQFLKSRRALEPLSSRLEVDLTDGDADLLGAISNAVRAALRDRIRLEGTAGPQVLEGLGRPVR